MSNADTIIEAAKSQLGSPYVYGTWGQLCTPALRKRYSEYTPSQKEITYKRCPVLSDKQPTCSGCKYNGMLAFDCRGFTHWCVLKGGIDIYGQKVSVQLETDKNWDVRGDIAWVPELVGCVFLEGHTGMYLMNDLVIHCSGEVKQEQLGEGRKWTKFAVPKGLYTMKEIAEALSVDVVLETLRRGSQGHSVAYLQALLNDAGYECGLVDGKYGSKTENAVKALQEANSVKADGICGPRTWALLVDPDQPELDEDDDIIPEIPSLPPESPSEPSGDTAGQTVRLSSEEAQTVRKCLLTALDIINKAIGGETNARMDR